MSEKHLAERLMYPLPDGWRDDPEQVAALKEIWPKIITKNKELIDAEITSLRAQLDEAKCKIEELGTHCALHESLAHGYTDEIAELQCRVDEARRKAIEDAAKTAEAFAKNHGVQWGDRKRFELHDIQRAVNGACGLIAEDIRALLSESKS